MSCLFNCSHIAHYVYALCPFSDPDVCHFFLVCDIGHTSFPFVLCLVSYLAYEIAEMSLTQYRNYTKRNLEINIS